MIKNKTLKDLGTSNFKERGRVWKQEENLGIDSIR